MEEFLLDAVVLRILGHLALFSVVLKYSHITHLCIYLWSHHFKQGFLKYLNHKLKSLLYCYTYGTSKWFNIAQFLYKLFMYEFYHFFFFFYLSRLNFTFLLSIFSIFKEESYPTNFLSQWYSWKYIQLVFNNYFFWNLKYHTYI